MLIGNAGLGVGSTIKEYRHYQGSWKHHMQGGNTHVCLTSEYMTPQTLAAAIITVCGSIIANRERIISY
ncbi:hypothetical protein MBANPS3_005790 [Mucor bainieri]